MKREEVSAILSAVLKKMDARLSAERFQPQMVDGEFLSYARVAVQVATTLNAVLRDAELSDMARRIEALEAKRHDGA